MQVPRLVKIVVNIGLGEALQNAKALDAASKDLTLITGQKPIITRASKSIATFRLRAGNPIGVKVTLRGERMYGSWIVCSTSLCHGCATFVVSPGRL